MKVFSNISNWDIERFWCKVEIEEGENTCWNWLDSPRIDGYGTFYFDDSKSVVLAHRFSYIIAHPDEDISNRLVRHSCDNRICVRPIHLLSGTDLDNAQDRAARGRNRKSTMPAHLVAAIKIDIEKGIEHRVLANKYGVGMGTISRIRNNKVDYIH